MKYMKVRFTEWRDAPAAKMQLISEVAAAQAKLVEIDAREAAVRGDLAHAQTLIKIADTVPLRDRLAGLAVETDNVFISRKAALAALEAAGQAEMTAMKSHQQVGKFGYQIIDEARMEVVRLTDEAGNDLPAGAVYGYEIIDQSPPPPPWAAAAEAALKL